MPRPINDRRSHAHHAQRSASPATQSLLLERAETRIAELETENAQLRVTVSFARQSHRSTLLTFLTPRQTVWLALAGVGVCLAFLFHTLARH